MEFESPSRKRKAPDAGSSSSSSSNDAAAANSSSSSSSSNAGGRSNFDGVELDEVTGNMTVEQFLKDLLAKMIDKAQEIADDAIEGVQDLYKMNREDVKNLQHARNAEQAAKNKAGKKKVWDVQLTVQKTAEEQPELVGAVFTIHPRQRPGGMCKIGRSTGVDFTEGKGVSLPKDWGVSTWHGKFTSVYGTIYYTDLSKYGTKHNGEKIERDQPVALKNGDQLELGTTVLSVKLVQASSAAAAAAAEAGDADAAEGENAER